MCRSRLRYSRERTCQSLGCHLQPIPTPRAERAAAPTKRGCATEGDCCGRSVGEVGFELIEATGGTKEKKIETTSILPESNVYFSAPCIKIQTLNYFQKQFSRHFGSSHYWVRDRARAHRRQSSDPLSQFKKFESPVRLELPLRPACLLFECRLDSSVS